MTSTKNKRTSFLAVDLYQKQYSSISVNAIYEIYADKFNVSNDDMRYKTLQECIESLRKINPQK